MKNHLLIVIVVFASACILCFTKSYNTLSAAPEPGVTEFHSEVTSSDTISSDQNFNTNDTKNNIPVTSPVNY